MARADTLAPALKGISRALIISSSNSQMVETQCRFIDACKAAGVAHVVKFSGKETGIGFDAKNFRFTRMHEEIEQYLEGSGLAWTHLRPSQFMQVYLRESPTIARKGLLLLPLEDVRLSPVDIEDVAKIAFVLLTKGGHEGRAFDITGPQALSCLPLPPPLVKRSASRFAIRTSAPKIAAARCWQQVCRHSWSTHSTSKQLNGAGIRSRESNSAPMSCSE